MILQALMRYYERSEDLPREGWVRRGVDYVVVLDEQGRCVNIELIGEQKKGKIVPYDMLVPAIGKQAMKHTNSGNDANLLWDNASFVFGSGNKGNVKITSFLTTMRDWLGGLEDTGITAVYRFCTGIQSEPDSVLALLEHFHVKEDFDKRDPVLVFRMASDIEPIHVRPAVRSTFEKTLATASSNSSLRGNCLVTGEMDVPIAPNESVIKGVWGGQPAGCNIVSFNARAFESYGKRDRNGENAPISLRASFSYTTALNHLLASPQRVQVGDSSTVFWAEERHDLETAIPDLFGEPRKDNPARGVNALNALYASVQSGKFSVGDTNTRFHVLGLAPNVARIAIRFWETASAIDLARRIREHFEDLRIVHADYESEHLSLTVLLKACSRRKADGFYDIPPNLGGEVMRSILEGMPYPAPLLGLAIQRCRAEQAKKNELSGNAVHHVSYERAAIIKAYLNRLYRYKNQTEEEIAVSLDLTITAPAYRLGRLFATFERMQEAASERELNKTIRDTYFGAAMSTPRSVFPRLIRLNQHHLRDIKRSRPRSAGYFDGLLQEINSELSPVSAFPATFKMEDQGLFALGYYHQRQAFFAKQESNNNQEESK